MLYYLDTNIVIYVVRRSTAFSGACPESYCGSGKRRPLVGASAQPVNATKRRPSRKFGPAGCPLLAQVRNHGASCKAVCQHQRTELSVSRVEKNRRMAFSRL